MSRPAPLRAPHGIRQRLPIQLAWSEEGPSRLTIAEAFAAAVVRARQRVRICSPYFLPPTLILDALRLAARGGIRVEVMIPTCSDSPFTDLISDSYAGDLLDAGIELYRYDNGFLHAKLLIVDDDTASVGTANMDYRSLLDNLEVTASSATGRSSGSCPPPSTAIWPRAGGSCGTSGGRRHGGARWAMCCGSCHP